MDVEVGGGERGVLIDWAYHFYLESRLDALIENDMEAMHDMNKVDGGHLVHPRKPCSETYQEEGYADA